MRFLFFSSRPQRSLFALNVTYSMLACCAMLGSLTAMTGCGGGSSDPTPSPSPSPSASPIVIPVPKSVAFDLTWAGRTRGGFNVGSVNSARSAQFSFYSGGARKPTADAVVRVNRDDRTDSYTVTLNTGSATIDANDECLIDAVFYAGPDQSGAVVTGASVRSAINKDTGVLEKSFSLTGEVKNIDVVGGAAFVGEVQDVTVNVTSNRFGTVIPVSPGSLVMKVVTGADKLSIVPSNGPTDPIHIIGIRPGVATVTASVDGVTSPPVTFNVASRGVVTILPAQPAVFLDKQIRLTATVSGLPASVGAEGQAVTWSVPSADGGTISPDGVYTAPTREGDFTVQATSVYDPSKSATTSVKVTSGVQVSVSPANANLSWNESTAFTAQVINAPAGQTGVTWSVNGGDVNGTITPNGVYTAPKKDGTYTITATSTFDNRRVATATITVASQVGVTISPATDVKVNVNATQQFAATVTRFVGDGSVKWTVEPDASGAAVGTISATGLYSAPPKRVLVFIRATSNFDPSRFARVPVQVTAGGADIGVK